METRDQRQEVHLHEKPAKEYAFDKFAYELASGSVSGKRALRLLGALLRGVITSSQKKEPATSTSFLPEFPPHPEVYENFLEGASAPEEVDYAELFETQCGATDDSQAVEQYDGTLGVSTDFVGARQRPVGNIHWNNNLSTIYTNPGSVSGVRWCSGTLISADLFLTAGHCFDSNPSGWTVPLVNGTPNRIPPAEIATNMHIDFDYQVDASGNLRTEQSFAITRLEEHRLGGLDYAIVRLNGRPGDTFGFTSISSVDAAIGDMLCIIGHPAGVPKRIEAGPATDFHDSRIGYNDIDTLGGNSGSGILHGSQQTIVGVHTNGGCTVSGSGHNHGQRISSLTTSSPILRGLITPSFPDWELLDNNPATVDIVAAGGNLYQRHNNGFIWRYTGPPLTGWQLLDNNPATVDIVAAGGNLYQRHNNGFIWRYTGTPLTGWELLDNNPATVDIVAAGGNLYQRHSNGLIWRYTGPPLTGWQLLDNNPATVDIVAADNSLYQRHSNGFIWRYTGTPLTGWELLDNNPATVDIVAAGGNLYQRHNNGLIWRYTGPPLTGWQLLDNNPATVDIVAAGGNLYQRHNNGLIWRYTGPPLTGWRQLDNNPATVDIVAADNSLYQRHNNGFIWRYTGS